MPKLGNIETKCDKYWTFEILKSPSFAPIGFNLVQFEAKSDIVVYKQLSSTDVINDDIVIFIELVLVYALGDCISYGISGTEHTDAELWWTQV